MATAATLLRDARTRAGLTQRDLARLAGTAQSVVARIERSQVSPSWDTLERLVDAAGFALSANLYEAADLPTVAVSDVARVMSLSAAERLQELRNVDRFFAAIRRAS